MILGPPVLFNILANFADLRLPGTSCPARLEQTLRFRPMQINAHRPFFWLVLFLVALTLAACSGSYGRLQRSGNISKIFERHELLPDHYYYITGSDARPKAILAIDRSYSLKPGLWRSVEMTPALLARRVDAMTDQLGFTPDIMGAVITDPAGRPVGAWYSPYSRTTVRFEPDNTIVVSLPSESNDPFLLNRGRRSGRPF